MNQAPTKKIIVAITGTTGVIIGVRVLEALRDAGVETHLILSKWAIQTLQLETPYTAREIRQLASADYSETDMGAVISSGSFLTDGMIVVPCSMRTLASISHGTGSHLVHRAADVILKERRHLVLVPREMPLSEIHLENMLRLARMGVGIVPPLPAFYNHPRTLEDMVNHIVARILDQFAIDSVFARRWDGNMQRAAS